MPDHHKHRKQIENRLAKIEGHVRSVKNMTSEGRDCGDLLIQIAAIRCNSLQFALLLTVVAN